jgi:hypothetical protein
MTIVYENKIHYDSIPDNWGDIKITKTKTKNNLNSGEIP